MRRRRGRCRHQGRSGRGCISLGVSVWVGEAVDLAEASDARDVGVKVPSPAGGSRQPASPRTTNDARAIARYCRAKILPTVVERGVK